MKKIIYLFLIMAASAAMFFIFNVRERTMASPAFTGRLSTDNSSPTVDETFNITITALTDEPGKTVHWLSISEIGNKSYYYNCLTEKEENFPGPTPPNVSPKINCSHTWTISKSSPGVYTFKGDVDQSLYSFRDGRLESDVLNLVPTSPSQLSVSVIASPTTPPASANDICAKSFIVEGQNGDWWCGRGQGACQEQNFSFCNGNTSYNFGCKIKVTPVFIPVCNCDLITAKEVFNDLQNCPNPATPSLISPINDVQVSKTFTLQWNGVVNLKDSKIANYEWMISEAVFDEFYGYISGPRKDSGPVGSSQFSTTISPQLENNKHYLWTVRAITEDGRKSLWAPYGLFKTQIASASLPEGAVPPPDSTGGVGRNCPAAMSIENPSTYQAGDKVVAYDGLVPCGKCVAVNGTGQYVPCQFCHFFVMFYGIVDFLIWKITLPAAILLMVIGGAMFVFSAGQPKLIQNGKSIMTSVAIGLAIIFAAYMIVGAFLHFLGLADWTWQIYQDWSRGFFQFNCPINI